MRLQGGDKLWLVMWYIKLSLLLSPRANNQEISCADLRPHAFNFIFYNLNKERLQVSPPDCWQAIALILSELRYSPRYLSHLHQSYLERIVYTYKMRVNLACVR